MKPFFIITGHGRSGTKYMAALMGYFGYSVAHQKRGRDGSSSFHAAKAIIGGGKDEWGWCPPRSDPWVFLFHVVRNPWRVIESDVGVEGSPSQVISDWFPAIKGSTPLETSIRSVVLWNEAIEKGNPDLVVKVEEAPGRGDWDANPGIRGPLRSGHNGCG